MNLKKMLLGGMVALGTLGQQAMASAEFNANRTDFRDETIYFAMTTRFYDGDPKNNVCTWDKQEQQISTKDPAWRGDFAGLIEKLDYIKLSVSLPSGLPPWCRTAPVSTTTDITPWI